MKKIFYKKQYISLLNENNDLFNQNDDLNIIQNNKEIINNDVEEEELEQEEEFETTVRFKIPFSIFSYYKDELWTKLQNKQKSFVIYISDDGYDLRIHSNKFQKKNELERANYLVYLNNKFIPYSQTKSIESLAFQCIDYSKIQTIVTRYTLFELQPDNKDDFTNIRIVIESISNDRGIDYMFAAEIEYAEEIYLNNNSISKTNNILFKYIKEILNPVWSFINIEYDVIKPENVINIPSRIFHPFYQIDVTNYLIKYKFDGYKGKMIYTKNNFYYFDDLHNFNIIKIFPEIFKLFENIIFQFEIVQNDNNNNNNKENNNNTLNVMVLTDIIGVYINNTLYTLKPTEVLKVFEYISQVLNVNNINNVIIELDNNIIYPLQLQKAISNEELKNNEINKINLLYDGYIIVSNELEIKYKIPTCDVRLFNYMLYIDNMNEPITSDMFYNDKYVNNSIYEVSIDSTGSIYILRKRHDRMFTSTELEYINFIQLTKKMLTHKLL